MKPSEYELKLLRPIWREKRLSAREIHEASKANTGWSYSATRKTIDRMVDKGLLSMTAIHGLHTYAAVQSRVHVMAALITGFSRDVLDLNAPLPAAAFTGSALIAPDEIEELERLLEQMAATSDEADGEAR